MTKLILSSGSPRLIDHNLSNITISVREVSRLSKKLDPKNATVPDKIPVVILRNFKPELSQEKLFNRRLKDKSLPSLWKVPSLYQIFKNVGVRSSLSQYRRISLLSSISKISEAIINKKVVTHLEKNKLFSGYQYGFRSSQCTAEVLTAITHSLSKVLVDKHLSRTIVLDRSKDFVTQSLLHKLSSFEITRGLISIMKTFITCTSQGMRSTQMYIRDRRK